MSRKTYNKWTESEIELLRKLAKECNTRKKVALQLKRGLKSVEKKAEYLDIMLPSVYNRKDRALKLKNLKENK